MTELVLDALSVARRGRMLLHPVTARIAPGRFTAIVGPNGAGKSTLLRAAAGLVPATGAALVAGQRTAAMSHVARARLLGFLPQQHDFAWPVTTRAMVGLGLYAFGGEPATTTAHDAAIDAALAACGIAALAHQPVDQLSGGETALVALARVLVADTPLLLLDEPVAALDVARQYAVLEHLAVLTTHGRTVVAVLHDIALVAQFADRILWLNGGKLIADTDASVDIISNQVQRLFGRAVHWNDSASRPAPYFQR